MQELASEAIESGEIRITDYQLGEQTYLFTFIPLTEEGYLNLYGRDITERVEAEKRVQQSEEHFRTLLETAPNAILVLDENYIIQRVNFRAEKIFAYSRNELLGQSGEKLIPEHYIKLLEMHRRVHRNTSHTHRYWGKKQLKGRRKDGSQFPVEVSLRVQETVEGLLVTVIVHDITAQVRAEQKIQRSHQEQVVLNTLLRIAMEDLPLEAQLDRALDEIVTIPWLPAGVTGGLFLVEEDDPETLVLTHQRNFTPPHRASCARIRSGQCLCGKAFASGEVVFSDRVDEQHEIRFEGMLPHGHYVIPISGGQERLGVLTLYLPEGHQEEPHQVDFLLAAAGVLGSMVQRNRSEAALLKLSRVVEQTDDGVVITATDGIIQYVNPAIERMTGYRAQELLGDTPRVVKSGSHDRSFYRELWDTIQAGETYRGTLINRNKRGDIFHVDQTITPLVDAQGGITHFVSTWKDVSERVRAEQELQKRAEELVKAYNTTLEGWAKALELRDEETEGHTRRVTEMTVRLARELGINGAELEHVRRGALLHDIGKMGVPDRILCKPGPLTDEEWEIMRQHPKYAYEMLAGIDYLRPSLDIPYGHHEKWDGSGYPRGLKGEQIPFAARVFAVVDVWDALSSDRPYRKAWPEEKVLVHIQEQSGSHFESRVVEAFLEMIESPTTAH